MGGGAPVMDRRRRWLGAGCDNWVVEMGGTVVTWCLARSLCGAETLCVLG